MILNNGNIDSLRSPVIWQSRKAPPSDIVQGISLTIVGSDPYTEIRNLRIENGRISCVVAQKTTILCSLDTELNGDNFVYNFEGVSDRFIAGYIVLAGLSTYALKLEGTVGIINPTYVHLCKNRVKTPVWLLVDGAAIDLNTLRIRNTADVTITLEGGTAMASVNPTANGVQQIYNDKITSINGQPVKSEYVLNIEADVVVSACSPLCCELLTSGGGCVQDSYMEDKLAPNGRFYTRPIDVAYTSGTPKTGKIGGLTGANYALSNMETRRYETGEIEGGLDLYANSPLHDHVTSSSN